MTDAENTVEDSADEMAAALRRRRVRLSVLAMITGCGLVLLMAWFQWSARSQHRRAVADFHAKKQAFAERYASYSSQLEDGLASDPPPELADGLLDQLLTSEPQYQGTPGSLLTPYLALATVGLLVGGLRAFRRARAEQRIADAQAQRSTPA